MWRCRALMKQALSSAPSSGWRRSSSSSTLLHHTHSYSERKIPLQFHYYSASSFCFEKEKKQEEDHITFHEAKKLLRSLNVESLKSKLGTESSKEVIPYHQLLETCQVMGVVRTLTEATAFARVLDDAGVVLLFRDKVYLHPHKVVDLIRNAVLIALTPC